MSARRMFLQLSVLAGCLAFFVTLARAIGQHETDCWQISVHATGAGLATIIVSLLIASLIQKLGGPDREPTDTDTNIE